MKLKTNQQITFSEIVQLSLLLMVAQSAVANGTSNLTARPTLCPVIELNQATEIDRQAIETLMAEWEAAVQAVDFDTLASLVTVDAEFWTHGAEPLVGRDALIAVFKPFLAQYEMQQKYHCKELIITGNWAFLRGLEVNELKDRASGESSISKQRAFSVLKKDALGQWRFARGMTNRPAKD